MVRYTQVTLNPNPCDTRVPDIDHIWATTTEDIPNSSMRVKLEIAIALRNNASIEICGVFWNKAAANLRVPQLAFDCMMARVNGGLVYQTSGGYEDARNLAYAMVLLPYEPFPGSMAGPHRQIFWDIMDVDIDI